MNTNKIFIIDFHWDKTRNYPHFCMLYAIRRQSFGASQLLLAEKQLRFFVLHKELQLNVV